MVKEDCKNMRLIKSIKIYSHNKKEVNNESIFNTCQFKKINVDIWLFNTVDLIIFGSGLGVTLLLLAIIGPSETLDTFIVLLPALITGLLVAPIPNYHNVRTAIKSVWQFFTLRQSFIWKGWCIKDEYSDKK